MRRGAAIHDHITFIQFQSNRTGHSLLSLRHKSRKGFSIGRIPETVINELCHFRSNEELGMEGVSIENQRFKLPMSRIEQCGSGRLVNAPRFHTDQSIFNHIDTTDSVTSTDLI